jgi:hypothetical protein
MSVRRDGDPIAAWQKAARLRAGDGGAMGSTAVANGSAAANGACDS